MLALNRPEVADAAADIGAGILGKLGRELSCFRQFKARALHCLHRSCDGVMNKGAHLARLFLGNEFEWIEVFDLGRKLYRKLLSIKPLDVVDTCLTTHQR